MSDLAKFALHQRVFYQDRVVKIADIMFDGAQWCYYIIWRGGGKWITEEKLCDRDLTLDKKHATIPRGKARGS